MVIFLKKKVGYKVWHCPSKEPPVYEYLYFCSPHNTSKSFVHVTGTLFSCKPSDGDVLITCHRIERSGLVIVHFCLVYTKFNVVSR